MLNSFNKDSPKSSEGTVWGPPVTSSVASLLGIVRRQFPIFVGVVTIFLAAGLVYLFVAAPQYTSVATMVIDTRNVKVFQGQSTLNDAAIDISAVQTQIELLKSDNVSLAVVRDQHLTSDPEFVGSGGGILSNLSHLLFHTAEKERSLSEAQLTRQALAAFEGRRSVNRVTQSYVMEIGFRSANPEKSVRLSNAIVEAYINDQLEGKYQSTKRASLWLQDRLRELRTQASTAQKAVVDFKQSNNIVDTGGPGARLMSDQQLSEVNSQLILAEAATAEAKARYDRIHDIMKAPIPDESVTDALKSEVIIKLRSQYLDLAQKASIWAQRYGPNHLATVNLQTQMLEIRKSISDEMQKIAQSYKSEYDIAKAREVSIRTSLANAVSTSQTSNIAQVKLRELESSASSYRSLYDNFLQRYMEIVQQQSFPITEARLIGPAQLPLSKSSPKTAIILLLTLVLGLAASFSIAIIREMTDRVFRSSEQVETELKINCLAVLPNLKTLALAPGIEPVRGDIDATGANEAKSPHTFYGHVLDAPFSLFAEGLRGCKMAMDVNGITRVCKVVGFTSTLPREGKSTVATNFAQMIAHSGARVALIDGDLRNPTLSRNFGGSRPGLIDVLTDQRSFKDSLILEPQSGLKFLPAGVKGRMPHTNELLASQAMSKLVKALQGEFDYVVIDLPPLLPVVDARATASYVDSYIYVVEWGRSKVDAVQHALAGAPEIHDKLLGVILNKAELSVLRRYDGYRSSYYNNKYYAQYGYTDKEVA